MKLENLPRLTFAIEMLKHRKWAVVITAVSLVALLLCGIFAARTIKTAKQESVHAQVIDQVNRTIPYDKKINLLKKYMRQASNPRLIEEAQQLLDKTIERKVQNELSAAGIKAEALIKSGQWQPALSIFEELEKKYHATRFSHQIHQKKEINRQLIDTIAYETLVQQTDTIISPERAAYYHDFITSYPDSRFRKEIEKKIADMEKDYFAYTEMRLLEIEKLKDWDACLEQTQRFVEIYPYSVQIDVLSGYQDLCKKELEATESLSDLKEQAESMADDYDGRIRLFSDYLDANPQTRIKDAIDKEINALQALSEKKRVDTAREKIATLVQGQGKRFKLHEDATVYDTQTGLMWCLMDSTAQLNKCLNFNDAEAYVEALDTGGYTDWRLPSTSELAALYHTPAAFPAVEPAWYWTNRTHKSYKDRWITEVEVVATTPPAEEKLVRKGDWLCGSVRAVRGGGQK